MIQITKKIVLSLGFCSALLMSGVSFNAQVKAQAPAVEGANNMANAMAVFDKMTPEQQKEYVAQAKKTIDTQMNMMMEKASTPEQKKAIEDAKQQAYKKVNELIKMTPQQREAMIKQAQQNINTQLNNLTPEQLKQLTPQQRAAIEKFRASQAAH